MMNKKFDDFVNEQNEKGSGVDTAAKISEWRQWLGGLYGSIEGFLEPYTRDKKIRLGHEKKRIHEESLGAYEVDVLSIVIGGITLRLEPIAAIVIAAKGRVDMIGPRGVVRLVVVPKEANGLSVTIRTVTIGTKHPTSERSLDDSDFVWKIATRPPRIRYIDLTADSFYDAMMEVAHGS